MLKLKRNKKLMIPVLAMVLVAAMAGNAFAVSSLAYMFNTTGQVWGSSVSCTGLVDSDGYLSGQSDSDYVTAYSFYNGSYNHPTPLYKGQPTRYWSYTVAKDTDVAAVFEAYFGTSNTGRHYLEN